MTSFGGAGVLALESRRAKEIAELIRINEGDPYVAPSLVEVPLTVNEEALAFDRTLQAGGFDMVVLLTGVGTRFLAKVIATQRPEAEFLSDLRRVTVVARGPKPAAVLQEWQVPVTVRVPEPNTYRELLAAVAGVEGRRVAVQEYGRPNKELLEGLQAQGREVTPVPVYQWRLPDDTAPLREAVRRLVAGHFQVVLFTTGVQVEHLLRFAEEEGERDRVFAALRQSFLASIGPTCSEAMREAGLWPAMEPSHPKMGLLVREAALVYGRTRTDVVAV